MVMVIYFYSHRDVPYGCFSNFSEHGFELDGVWWPTGEHYFQGQKFAGTPHVEEIRQARTARNAADMGCEVAKHYLSLAVGPAGFIRRAYWSISGTRVVPEWYQSGTRVVPERSAVLNSEHSATPTLG